VTASGLPFIELDASTPRSMQNLIQNSRIGQLIKLGRVLTDPEIATYETHLRAQSSEFSRSNLWTIVFEDDAKICGETISFLKSLVHIQSSNPIHVNLLPNRGVTQKFLQNADTTTTSLIRVDNLYSGAVAYAINLAAQKKIEESIDFKAITPADFPPLFNTFEKYICSSRLVEHLENIPSTIYKENIIPRNNKVFVVFGLFSLFSYVFFRREHVSFKNYLNLEIRQRYQRNKLGRFHVS